MEKIKQFTESDKGKDILVIVIIILVGLGSFELGRLSKNSSSSLKIEYPSQESNVLESINQNPTKLTQNSTKSISGNFFASNRGTKYYSISCSAGKTIKEENRIYFATSTEAESAGYQLSTSCR
ncbi:MAG: Ada metal-binding domain-containing protein [Patescibacteria group bacterium]